MLLELFSGKSPTDEYFTGGLTITKWVQSAFTNNTVQIIDPQLLSLIYHDDHTNDPNLQHHCVTAIMEVGLSCTADNPDERIGIREVVRQLNVAKDSLLKKSDTKSPSSSTTKGNFQVSK